MTFADRISSFAGAVRDKLNLMSPRLLAEGGSPGQIYTRVGASHGWVDAPSGGGGGSSVSPFLIRRIEGAGRAAHFIPPADQTISASATGTIPANMIAMAPHIVSGMIESLSFQITTGTSVSAKVGVYGCDADGLPTGAPLAVSNAVTGLGAGVHIVPLTAPLAVAGPCWAAIIVSVAATLRAGVVDPWGLQQLRGSTSPSVLPTESLNLGHYGGSYAAGLVSNPSKAPTGQPLMLMLGVA